MHTFSNKFSSNCEINKLTIVLMSNDCYFIISCQISFKGKRYILVTISTVMQKSMYMRKCNKTLWQRYVGMRKIGDILFNITKSSVNILYTCILNSLEICNAMNDHDFSRRIDFSN